MSDNHPDEATRSKLAADLADTLEVIRLLEEDRRNAEKMATRIRVAKEVQSWTEEDWAKFEEGFLGLPPEEPTP